MADAAKILERIRSYGANVVLDGQKLEIINSEKLPAGAADFLKQHNRLIADHLAQQGDFDEHAAVLEFDGGMDRKTAERLTRLLFSSPPADVNAADWTWFVGKAAKIIDDATMGRAA